MDKEYKFSMEFTLDDWSTICSVLEHAEKSAYIAADRYARDEEDRLGYLDLGERNKKIMLAIRNQFGKESEKLRSLSDGKD